MKKTNYTLVGVNLTILTLGFVVYVLYIGASLLIPFLLAVLISFIIISTNDFYKKHGVPKYLSFIAALFTLCMIFFVIWKIIDSNVDNIIQNAPEYQDKLVSIFDSYADRYEVDTSIVRQQIIERINIPSVVSGAANIVTAIVKNAGIILFFTIFILMESGAFWRKMSTITGGEKSTFFQIFEQIQSDMKSYFLIKTIASLSVSFMSAVILFFFGIDFFIFWAFIIFLFNYIPNVGSVIAVMFPVIFSLIQFENLSLTLVLFLLLTAAQVFIGSLVEPRMMGNKLNLSPLVILISLIFWGTLWGPIGMLLSIPIMVMLNIVLAHIEATRPLAVLFSQNGIIKLPEDISPRKSLASMRNFLKK